MNDVDLQFDPQGNCLRAPEGHETCLDRRLNEAMVEAKQKGDTQKALDAQQALLHRLNVSVIDPQGICTRTGDEVGCLMTMKSRYDGAPGLGLLLVLFMFIVGMGILAIISMYIRAKMNQIFGVSRTERMFESLSQENYRRSSNNISSAPPIDEYKSDPLRQWMPWVERINQEIMFNQLTPDEAVHKIASIFGGKPGEIYRAWVKYGN